LFCKQKEGEELTYQVFIEPKGNHLGAGKNFNNGWLNSLSL
jgi:type III restriction enzyme